MIFFSREGRSRKLVEAADMEQMLFYSLDRVLLNNSRERVISGTNHAQCCGPECTETMRARPVPKTSVIKSHDAQVVSLLEARTYYTC